MYVIEVLSEGLKIEIHFSLKSSENFREPLNAASLEYLQF